MFFGFMCLSIIIPTYNEAENIKILLPKLFKIMGFVEGKKEIIIVDDNSPDGTANIASSFYL